MSAQETVVQFLAQTPPSGDSGGQGEDFGKSSPVGLLLLVLFAIAVGLLVWSMTKHLKKLPTNFDEERAAAAAPARAKRGTPAAVSAGSAGAGADSDSEGGAAGSSDSAGSSGSDSGSSSGG